MNPNVLKIMAAVAGVIIGGPLAFAGFRAVYFFGTMATTVSAMGEELRASTKATNGFHAEVSAALKGHENRLTTIEAERRVERDHGRRRDDAGRGDDERDRDT